MAKSISELKIKIGADSSELKKELNEAQHAMQTALNTKPMESATAAFAGISKETGNLIGKFQSMAAAAAGAFGLAQIIDGAVQAGDNVYKLSNRLNVTTAEAGKLSRILKLTGGDVDSFSSAFMRLDKTIFASGEAGEKARNTLDLFGVSLTDAGGKLLPLNEQLENLANGYKTAKEAGVQQEFLMTTLGTRGLALAQTLEQYTEAAETAARVKSIGLDAKELHELALNMKVMQMEAQQVQLAFTSALTPIAESVFPVIIEGLTGAATWLAKNKQEVREVTAAVVKFVAAYKGIKIAVGAISTVQSFWIASRQAAIASAAAQTATQTEITAAHEREIAKRIAAVERASQQQQNAAIKAAMKANLSAEETTARIVAECTKIELKSAETAERIAAGMRAAFLAEAQAATMAAGETTAALNSTAIAAERAGTAMTGAHVGAAESGQIAASVERELALATTNTGNAAVVAGEKNVAAKTQTTIATEGATMATNTLTAATVAQGNAAVATGTRAIGVMATVTTAVGSLTRAVWTLAGGWLGVAAAIGYATYKLGEYFSEKMEARKKDTYNIEGQTYYWDKETGKLTTMEATAYSSDAEASGNIAMGYGTGGISAYGEREVEVSQDSDAYRKFENAWWERHKEDADYKAKQEEEEAQERSKDEADRLQRELLESLQMTGADLGGTAAGGAVREKAAPVPTDYNIEYPVGKLVADIAADHPQGEPWMGDITNNPAIQCDSYTANVYAGAGIDSIGGQSTAGIINDAAFRAAGAYHSAGSGYEPEAGDLVDFAGHVGIYMGNGLVNSRQSAGGVKTISMAEAENYFGAVQGYGSLAEATGGRTVTERRSGAREDAEAARQAQDAARKLEQGRRSAVSLFQTMANGISGLEDTSYMQEAAKIEQDVQDKRQQINRVKESGVSQKTVDILNKQLDEYAAALERQATEKWKTAFDQTADEAKRANAEILHDYEGMAAAEYAATVRKLTDERREKEKEVMRDKDDWQSKAAVSDWYYAKLAQAEEKRRQDLRKAHGQYIEYLQSEGKIAELAAHLNDFGGRTATEATMGMEGQEKLARTYVKIWKEAHGSVSGYIASAADSLYGTLSNSLSEFIQGAKSAKDVFRDFGKSVLSMMAQIAAQRFAANLMGGFLGNMFGGGKTAVSTSTAYTFPTGVTPVHTPTYVRPSIRAFATGGIVTAPTIGLIGEGGEREAVIPLNHENLSAIGGKGRGGNITVNVINNTGTQVKAEQTSAEWDGEQWVVGVVLNAVATNRNGIRTVLKGVAAT